jgi:hypothetical protein
MVWWPLTRPATASFSLAADGFISRVLGVHLAKSNCYFEKAVLAFGRSSPAFARPVDEAISLPPGIGTARIICRPVMVQPGEISGLPFEKLPRP